MKEFADDNFIFIKSDKKRQKVLHAGRKHCGKRRNCSLQAISPFFHSVFKRFVLQTSKNQGLFGKGFNTLLGIVYCLYRFSSYNNPCFPCNRGIRNFLVSHTREIRFCEVVDPTLCMFTSSLHPTQKFQKMAK